MDAGRSPETFKVERKTRMIREFEEKFKDAVTLSRVVMELYTEALTQLAIMYQFNPLLWESERANLNPNLRKGIEDILSKLPTAPVFVASSIEVEIIRTTKP